MKKTSKHIFLSVALVLLATVIQAAPSAPPGGGMSPPCWPPPCLPIDGGISFLIAAAAVYGGKKLYDHQKKS
jgi:hypothetical protein